MGFSGATLTFIFLEDKKGFVERQSRDPLDIQRKVQIKVIVTDFELVEGADTPPAELIEEYRVRCSRLKELTFALGNSRVPM